MRAIALIFLAFLPWSAQSQTAGSPAPSVSLRTTSCGNLTLTVIAENAIRVRCSRAPSTLPELIYTRTETLPARHGSDAHTSWIQTSRIRAEFDQSSGALRFYDSKKNLLTEEVPGRRQWSAGPEQGAVTGNAEVVFRLQPDEHLYGSGQFQDGYLNIARLPRKLVQLNSQISIPFLISNRGYGLLWHQYGMTELNQPSNNLALEETGSGQSVAVDVTTSAGTQRQNRRSRQFEGDFIAPQDADYALMLSSGRTMTDRWHLEVDGRSLIDFSNFWLPGDTSTLVHLSAGRHHVVVQANSEDHHTLQWGVAPSQTTFRSPDAQGIDYTIYAGTADEVISTHRTLSGGTPMLPKWAFGFIQCRERYHSSDEILDTLHQFRKDDLPLDTIVQDWQYWGKYGWNAMRFDEKDYPDPAKLVSEIHADHAHLMVSVWSRFDPKSEVGKQFQTLNYFIPGTSWVDFFNPAAQQLYWQNFSTRMRSLGIDAWWLDATEPENDDLHGRKLHVGAGDQYRLVYPLFVTRTVYEGSRRDAPNKRVMILTRSAFSGEQRYSISTWSGDIGNGWDTLKRQVTAGLDYAASGMPYWTTDTGGFFRPGKEQYTDPAYRERFLRWMQFSTFTPLLRVHGYQTNTEPWNYGPGMVQQQRDIEDLRYTLLPYIYSQAAQITSQGGTLMRPLVMDFPQDGKALDQQYEYMFGPAFLVAPVLDPGVTSARLYAPAVKGGWYDWWTGKHVEGGTTQAVNAPLNQIPLLVRAGSIVPVGPVQQYVDQERHPRVEIRVYPGADARFDLYDDDGTSYAYEQGKRSLVTLTWDDHAKHLQIGALRGEYNGMPKQRDFLVRYMDGNTTQGQHINYTGRKTDVRF